MPEIPTFFNERDNGILGGETIASRRGELAISPQGMFLRHVLLEPARTLHPAKTEWDSDTMSRKTSTERKPQRTSLSKRIQQTRGPKPDLSYRANDYRTIEQEPLRQTIKGVLPRGVCVGLLGKRAQASLRCWRAYWAA
jgi:hypothetical protein